MNSPALAPDDTRRRPSGNAETHRFKQALKDARAGLVESQYQLGLMLANGVGTRKDLPEALKWINHAAERGHATAQFMLGTHFSAEPGTAPEGQADEAKAFEWLFRAASQGHARAHWRMARLLRQSHGHLAAAHEAAAAGLGVPEAQVAVVAADLAAGHADAVTAQAMRLQALRQAAEQGLLSAQTELGRSLLQADAEQWPAAGGMGLGYAQTAQTAQTSQPAQAGDPAEGLRWLKRAAAKHWPPAVLALLACGADGGTLPHKPADPVDAPARHALGCLWERGLAGLPAHRDEAARWYALAAAQGHVESAVALGRLCEADDADRAIAHYQQAAAGGSPEALWRISQLLGGPRSNAQERLAAACYRAQAVQADHPPALLALALALDDAGRFGAVDLEQRDHALRRAAECGLPEAQRRWAQRLQAKAGQPADRPLSANDKQALLRQAAAWLQRAARQGDAAALSALGQAYRQGRGLPADPALGLELMRDAASQGDASARWQLALLMASGAPDLPRDALAAMAVCREAAESGFVPAQATMGVLCAASALDEEAVAWWRQAAGAGDAEAQVNLAQALTHGRGTAQDLRAAFEALLKAAEAGLAVAQSRLALAYATGSGVVADPIAAHQWFFIAKQSADAAAAQNLLRSREQLNAAGRDEAERRARDWLAGLAARKQL